MRSLLYSYFLSLLYLVTRVLECQGHGRLIEPPSRSSMWRFGYKTPKHYEDNQLFCGGVGVQYGQNDGKCGVCGDAWNGPRDHEPGGKYATGTIVRSYQVGQTINVTVDLTASHKGYFEFHICPSDDPFNHVTHECLDRYPLKLADTLKTRWPLPEDQQYSSKITLNLKLPPGMTCKACMLQWKYNAGNSWGEDPDGKGCIGCGNQEQFYGCADVAVGHPEVELGVPPDEEYKPRPNVVGRGMTVDGVTSPNVDSMSVKPGPSLACLYSFAIVLAFHILFLGTI